MAVQSLPKVAQKAKSSPSKPNKVTDQQRESVFLTGGSIKNGVGTIEIPKEFGYENCSVLSVEIHVPNGNSILIPFDDKKGRWCKLQYGEKSFELKTDGSNFWEGKSVFAAVAYRPPEKPDKK